MVNISISSEPHVGPPIVKRAEAEAARLLRAQKKEGRPEPQRAPLADAYASLMTARAEGARAVPS